MIGYRILIVISYWVTDKQWYQPNPSLFSKKKKLFILIYLQMNYPVFFFCSKIMSVCVVNNDYCISSRKKKKRPRRLTNICYMRVYVTLIKKPMGFLRMWVNSQYLQGFYYFLFIWTDIEKYVSALNDKILHLFLFLCECT